MKVFIENDLFVMPRNLMTMGRIICRWLKYNIADVILATKFCDHRNEWYFIADGGNVALINQLLPFHIHSLTVTLNGENSELVLAIDFCENI